jgi:hypothetical protein
MRLFHVVMREADYVTGVNIDVAGGYRLAGN